MSKILFFILTIVLSTEKSVATGIDINHETDCGNVDKIELLIQKGIVSKRLCIKSKKNQLSVILQSGGYSLGEYIDFKTDQQASKNPLVNFYNQTPKYKFQCSGEDGNGVSFIDLKSMYLNRKKELSHLAGKSFPKEEFERFATFINNLRKRTSDLNTLSPPKLVSSAQKEKNKTTTVQAFGYADGVRNITDDYDLYIYNQLMQTNPGAAQTFHNDHCADKDSALSHTRNEFLAKIRADNLKSQVQEYFKVNNDKNGNIIFKKSIGEASKGLNSYSRGDCYGYCAQRRGALLKLTIPGLSEDVSKKEIKYNEKSAFFFSPSPDDQLLMNKFAMQSFVTEYQEFLNTFNPKDEEQSKALLDEKNYLKRRYINTDKNGSNQLDEGSVELVVLPGQEIEKKWENALELLRFIQIVKEEVEYATFMLTYLNPKSSTGAYLYKNNARQYMQNLRLASNFSGISTLKTLIFETYEKYRSISKSLGKSEINSLVYTYGRNNDSKSNLFQQKNLHHILWGNDPEVFNPANSFYKELRTYAFPDEDVINLIPENQKYQRQALREISASHISNSILRYENLKSLKAAAKKEKLDVKVEGVIVNVFKHNKCLRFKELELEKGVSLSSDIIKECKQIYENQDYIKGLERTTIDQYPFEIDDNFKLSQIITTTQTTPTWVKDYSSSIHTFTLGQLFQGGRNWFEKTQVVSDLKQQLFRTLDILPKTAEKKDNHKDIFKVFLKKKFNVPDTNVTISSKDVTAEKPITLNKSVKFEEYFSEIIEWSRHALFNSIKIANVDENNKVTLESKPLNDLTFNSETLSSNPKVPLAESNKFLLPLVNEKFFKDTLSNLIFGFYVRLVGYYIHTQHIRNQSEQKMSYHKIALTEKEYNEVYQYFQNTDLPIKARKWPYFKEQRPDQKVDFIARNWKMIFDISFEYLKSGIVFNGNTQELSTDGTNIKYFTHPLIENIPNSNLKYFIRDVVVKKYLLSVFDAINERQYYSKHRKYGKENYIETAKGFVKYSKQTTKIPKPSGRGAQVSTIFSFLNYSEALAQMVKTAISQKNQHGWTNSKYFQLMFSPIPKNTKYVYYRPSTVNVQEDDLDGTPVYGFYHTACKTGVIFPDKEETTEFHYQTRYMNPRSTGNTNKTAIYRDYPVKEKSLEYKNPYDDTYYLPKDKNLKFRPLNLIKIKRPTAYILKSCKKCNCLADSELNGAKLEELLRKSIKLDFSKGYKFDKKISLHEKRYNMFTAFKGVYSNNAEATLADYNDPYSDYCMFTPIVPQSHEVGSGKGTPEDNTTNLANFIFKLKSCPFVEALEAKDVPQDIAKHLVDPKTNAPISFQELQALPDVLDPNTQTGFKKIQEIKEYCSNAVVNFPKSIKQCLASTDKLEYYLPASILKQYKTKTITPKSTFGASTIKANVDLKDDGEIDGTISTNDCSALNRVYNEQGSIINMTTMDLEAAEKD